MEPQSWNEFKGKMTAAGKTQEEVARALGVSRTAIRRAVKGTGCKKVRAKLVEKQLITTSR